MQERQTYLRQRECGRHVDMHDLLPHSCVVLFNRKPLAEDACVVHQAIESAKFLGEAIRQCAISVVVGSGQVHNGDGRAWSTLDRFDFIVEFFEFFDVAAMQNDPGQALQKLNQAYERGWRERWMLKIDYRLESLHGQEEFIVLQHRLDDDINQALAEIRSVPVASL